MLSDPKIAGQLRKNSSGHATRFFKKNHEILKFLQLWPKICECVRNHSIVTYVLDIFVSVCETTALSLTYCRKKSISQLGDWLLFGRGFIRVNSVKLRGENIVGQTDRQKMAKREASPGLSPAKKKPRHKNGCNYNSEFELTFDWVRRSDRGKQHAYCTVSHYLICLKCS